MVKLENLSKFIKAGIFLILLGFLTLAVEDFIWDERIQIVLYLIPIGFFISSFIAFSIATKKTTNI